MKNKIEIQILTSATRKELIELRDEIRNIKGLEGFELEIPKTVMREGTMGDDVMLHIAAAVLTGIGHFASEKIYEYLPEIKLSFNKIFNKDNKQDLDKMGTTKEWEAVVTTENGGVKSNIYLDDEGTEKNFSTSGYAVSPDKTFALLIGTSKYDDIENFHSIQPVDQNLEDMKQVLINRRLMGLQEKNVLVLLNETSVNIKLAINEISKRDGIDTLIIYFTGHGQNIGDKQLRIIAKDTRKIDEELHYDIPYSYVEQKLKNARALQKIILLDTCHSGLATQGNSDPFDFELVSGTFTLASTSADESAYFKKEATNTYFTGFLLDALRNGISNMNEMLSLHDLYIYIKEKLSESKLPAPTYKSQLENIIAEKFYISLNPAFLLDDRLKRPRLLYEAGDYESAKKDYLFLINTYPDNKQLNHEYLEFEKNIMYNLLLSEADKLFYEDKKYDVALSKYREALSIKAEEHVKNKIIECKKKGVSSAAILPEQNKILHKEITHNEPLGAQAESPGHPAKKTIALKPLILVFLLLSSTIIYFLRSHNNNTSKEPASDSTKSKQDSTNKQLINVTPSKDTAEPVNEKTKATDLQLKDLPQNISQVVKKPDESGSKVLLPKSSTSVADILMGVTYWEPINNNSLSFSYVANNKIHFEGSIADYPVSGEFLITGNKFLKASSANVDGDLTLSDDQRYLTGYIKIKGRDITKKLNLVKKIAVPIVNAQ